MTFKILIEDTSIVIPKSEIRPADDYFRRNLHVDPVKGEGEGTKPIILKSRHDKLKTLKKVSPDTSDEEFTVPHKLPLIDPNDLIGRTFLTSPDENGNVYRARITRKIIDADPNSNPVEDPSYSNVRFILQIDDNTADEIVGYNEVIDQFNKEIEDEF